MHKLEGTVSGCSFVASSESMLNTATAPSRSNVEASLDLAFDEIRLLKARIGTLATRLIPASKNSSPCGSTSVDECQPSSPLTGSILKIAEGIKEANLQLEEITNLLDL
ncbi:TPA: hypothetical protein ACQ49S_001016 [Klebsiella aerogenes]